MPALVWIGYLLAVCLNIFALTRMNVRSMNFMDGILIGCIYYIAIPMFFILMAGDLPPAFLNTEDYFPFSDVGTTAVLLTAMIVIPVMQITLRRKNSEVASADWNLLPVVTVIFLAATIYSFFNSGLASGGHWYHNASEVLSTSPTFLIAKHIANFSRMAMFGVLLCYNVTGRLSRRKAMIYGAAVVVIDMALTFNRITGVYYLIMVLIMLRRNRPLVIGMMAVAIIGVTATSNTWPIFRGLVGVYGYTPSGIASAAEVAIESRERDAPIVESMNSIFESENIVVLNFVIRHSGTDIPLLHGSMLIRPLTFFLPSMIWKDRPPGFATTLGLIIGDSDDLSLNSTLMGEPYANFGPFWIVALVPLLFAYHFAFAKIGSSSRAMGFVAAFVGLAMWRFDTVFGVICLVITAMLVTAMRFTAAKNAMPKPPLRKPTSRRTKHPYQQMKSTQMF